MEQSYISTDFNCEKEFRELFIANLDENANELDLYRIFSVFGEIEYIKIAINSKNTQNGNTKKEFETQNNSNDQVINQQNNNKQSIEHNPLGKVAKVVFFSSENAKEAKLWTNNIQINKRKIRVFLETKKIESKEINNESNNIKTLLEKKSKENNNRYIEDQQDSIKIINILFPTDKSKQIVIDNLAFLVSEVLFGKIFLLTFYF